MKKILFLHGFYASGHLWGEDKPLQIQRACSFGLACAFRQGRALQGFTSSALLHNTIALTIPNAEKMKKFHFF